METVTLRVEEGLAHPLCESCGEVEAEVLIRDGTVTTRFCRGCAPGPLLEGLSRLGGNVLTLAPR